MKQKPITPYARLLTKFKEFCDSVEYRARKKMFSYPKNNLGANWSMEQLYERVAAAEQLGFDVVVTASDADGLVFTYIKKLPQRPWSTK